MVKAILTIWTCDLYLPGNQDWQFILKALLSWHMFETGATHILKIQQKCFLLKRAYHGVLTATMALLQSSHGVLLRVYGVVFGDSLRSYDPFTVLSLGMQCVHCAFKTSALLKTQCSFFPTFPKFWPGAYWIWEKSICAIKIRVYLSKWTRSPYKNNKLSV